MKFLSFLAVAALVIVALIAPRQLQQARAQDAPTKVYMGDVQTAVAKQTEVPAEPTALPPPSDTPTTPYPTVEPLPADDLPPYVSMDDLPYCDESYDEITGDQPMPTEDQYGAASTCKLRGTEIKSDDESEVVNPWAFTGYNFRPELQDAATATKSWAINLLSCSSGGCSSNYISSIRMVISAKPPTLSSGNYGWSQYSVANRMHYGANSNMACYISGVLYQSTANVSIGVQYGAHLGGYTDDGWMHLFWERFLNADCAQTISATRINPNAAILFEMYTQLISGQYHWLGRAWMNSNWVALFDVESKLQGQNLDGGLELAANNQDKNKIKAPMNFIHKLLMVHGGTGYSWYDGVLPTGLTARTTPVAESPWNVMDSVGGDYTSISAEANIP